MRHDDGWGVNVTIGKLETVTATATATQTSAVDANKADNHGEQAT